MSETNEDLEKHKKSVDYEDNTPEISKEISTVNL